MKKIVLFLAIIFLFACEKETGFLTDHNEGVQKSAVLGSFPNTLQLPNGFQPEGIITGPNHSFYVGSLVSGQIYKGDLRTGLGEVLVFPTGFESTGGLSIDRRTGYLYAAKGFSGMGSVYDSQTGALIEHLVLTLSPPALINDVVVTNNAVYFTNSLAPVLYKVPLLNNGKLPDPVEVVTLTLSGDFSMIPNPNIPQLGAFANGIDATPNGNQLFLANTGRGEIYSVNPVTGEATLIDLDGALLPFADGILLDGMILYVVQNMFNQLAVIRLNDDMLSGEVIQTISEINFSIPTTVAKFGHYLYLVNSHFDVAPPGGIYPEQEFEVVKVEQYDDY